MLIKDEISILQKAVKNSQSRAPIFTDLQKLLLYVALSNVFEDHVLDGLGKFVQPGGEDVGWIIWHV